MPREGKVIVEGINIAKKHQRKQRQTMQAGIIEKAMPLEVSNVMLLSPSDGKPTQGRVPVHARRRESAHLQAHRS